ncbi:MAG: hypothetical protein ACO2ZM_09180, partial [Francisellaceae bacterium]
MNTRKNKKRLAMLLLSAVMMAGCTSSSDPAGSSATDGNDDNNNSVVSEDLKLMLSDEDLDVIDGATSSIIINNNEGFQLMASSSIEAKNINFYFDDNSDDNKFSIARSSGCSELKSGESCVIEITPNAGSEYKAGQVISGWVEGDNTDKYPVSLKVEAFSLSADDNVIGSGGKRSFTLTNPAKNAIKNIQLSTTDNGIKISNSGCGDELQSDESCQFEVDAANDAQNKQDIGIRVSDVDYSTSWPLSLIRPTVSLSALEDTLQASGNLSITAENTSSVDALGINLGTAVNHFGMTGVSINNEETTCTDTLKANSQCLLVLSTDDTLPPALSDEFILSGSNFNDTNKLVLKSYLSQLSVSVSPETLSANSGAVEKVILTVTNNTGFKADNITANYDSAVLSLKERAQNNFPLLYSYCSYE